MENVGNVPARIGAVAMAQGEGLVHFTGRVNSDMCRLVTLSLTLPRCAQHALGLLHAHVKDPVSAFR